MNTVVERKGFGWGFLLLGILFVVVSLVAFRNPLGNLFALAMVFGIMAILSGIWFVTNRFGSTFRLLIGILEIVIGLFLIFNPSDGATIIAVAFAVWFIADSVSNLFLLKYYRTLGNGYFWFMLVVNILGILVGAFMLYEPVISMLTISFIVGFYFMMIGIAYILLAFSNPVIRIETDSNDTIDV